jgi:hypothetical protein
MFGDILEAGRALSNMHKNVFGPPYEELAALGFVHLARTAAQAGAPYAAFPAL